MLKDRETVRGVYNSEDGRTVLTDILADLNFFCGDIKTEQEMAKQNSARVLLNRLGIWQKHNARRIVNALMDMPYYQKDEHE